MTDKQRQDTETLKRLIADLLEDASHADVRLVYIFVKEYLRKSKARKT